MPTAQQKAKVFLSICWKSSSRLQSAFHNLTQGQKMYSVHFSCFLAAFLIFTSTQATASKASRIAPYEKKYACKIQNPTKISDSWFTSVIQSMRGVPQLRHYCKKGKSTAFKKNLNTLFSHLEAKKRIKAHETKKWLRYFKKHAKKSKVRLPNYALIFAGYLLKNSGMPTFSYQNSMTIADRFNSRLSADQANISLEYAVNDVHMVALAVPDSNGEGKRYELKELLKEVHFTHGYEAKAISHLADDLGLPLPADVKQELVALSSWPNYRCSVKTHFQFADEKQVPKLLPIYLQRWQNQNLTAQKIKKEHFSYSSCWIKPSESIDIPLATNPNKMARYHLVSMVINRFQDITLKKTVSHAYAVVLTKKGKKRAWTFYDDNRIYKNAKNRLIEGLLPNGNRDWLYADVYENATLFFYQLSGFKTLTPPTTTSHFAGKSS